MTNLRALLEAKRDELALEHSFEWQTNVYEANAYKRGADAMLALLWPVVEALEKEFNEDAALDQFPWWVGSYYYLWGAKDEHKRLQSTLTALRDRLARGGRE